MITLNQIKLAEISIQSKVMATVKRLNELTYGLELPFDQWVIGHSGGKDSVVNHWLVSKTEAYEMHKLPVVHTSKPGGDNAIHPATLEFLYQLPFAVELWPRALGMNPKYHLQFDGSRASEYDRTDRSANFIRDGQSVNRAELPLVVPNSMFGMTFVFPMYDWSDADVWATIFFYNLPFSKEYEHEHNLYAEYEQERSDRSASR